MADNSRKTPLGDSMNRWATAKAGDAIQKLGKALPAIVLGVSGSIVTVGFQVSSVYTLSNVTVPIAGPEYARPPTQVGDRGVVFPADVYIGGVSGLGGGTASLTAPANLTALVFFPIGNVNFSPTDNPNAYLIYGPDGVIIRDTAKTSILTVRSNDINAVVGGSSFEMTTSEADLTATRINFNGGARAVARVGDFVAGGVITTGSTTVFSG